MKKKGNRLTDMEFDEVSLVTRPANQMSKVVLFKSDEPASSEEEQVNPEVEIEVTEVAEVAVEAVEAPAVADAPEAEESVEKGYGMKMKKKKKMIPALEDEEDDREEEEMMKKKKMKKDAEVEVPTEVYDYIEALESANAELVEQITKMAEEADAEAKAQDEEIFKSADPRLVELVKGLEERASAAEAIAKAERDHRLEQEFVSKASTLSNLSVKAEEFGVVLKGVADKLTNEQFDAIWQVLTSANANLAKSGLFVEFGKSNTADGDGPMSIIEKAAAELRQSNPSMTREQSIAKAVEADANLYNQYIREGK